MAINQYNFSNMFYIYYIENQINGKIYIGKSSERRDKNARWIEHCRDARKNRTKMPIHRAMKKYGIDNFKYTIFETFSTEFEAMESEKYWIQYLRSQNVELYNISDGGEGWGSYKRGPRTKEHSAKLKNFQKGHIPWTKGKNIPLETRKKISLNAKGRKISDSQRIEIKELYASGQYTQHELAVKFNVGPDQISRIINNKTGWISRKTMNNKRTF